MLMQFLDMAAVVCLQVWALRTWENIGLCKSGGKDSKRDYAKEKLRENMGQSESKERDFKE
jgi:hypothetical protein